MFRVVCRVRVALAILWAAAFSSVSVQLFAESASSEPIIGMYVHQHWPYNRPYAARTWTLDEWAGYADGLKQLGYNTIKIWPMLETMPDPLTKSDSDILEKMRAVIDVIHSKGMKVIIALCPNIVADSAVAGQMPFEKRHFFYCDLRVNPADHDAVDRMMRWREKLFQPLAKVDAVAIIDSDPAGYPGSNNAEFIGLLGEHRKMFDRLRPGIELLYWMHAGWPGYCRFYETGKFAMSKPEEYADALKQLTKLNPEPWGLAGNIYYPTQAGLTKRAIDYRYGAVENEPSIPSTNFGTDRAYKAAQGGAGRGVMANAQTHCLQLPNTFAFARGALGKSLTNESYVDFANQLLPGHGAEIVEGWSALRGTDVGRMRAATSTLEKLSQTNLTMGPLKGLLFGDPKRFLTDIAMQLQLQAAYEGFCNASEQGTDTRKPFCQFVDQFSKWQERHGYTGRVSWGNWPRLDRALEKLGSPEITATRHPQIQAKAPFAKVKEEYYEAETATARLINALQATASRMRDAPAS